MMGLLDDVKDLKDQIGLVTSHLKDEEIKRVKKKEYKLPFGIRLKGRRAVKQEKFLAIILHKNHKLSFKVVKVVGGLVEVNSTSYKAYEDGAVYFYKKFPVIVILDWRLTLVGGMTDFASAKEGKILDLAQETLIRVIEKVEVDKDVGKKNRKFPIGLLVIVVGVVIYLISKSFGG